jgi:hypothetical protein
MPLSDGEIDRIAERLARRAAEGLDTAELLLERIERFRESAISCKADLTSHPMGQRLHQWLECMRRELRGPRTGERLPETRRGARPTRDDVDVVVWEERDRLHIGIQDRQTGEYVADWWDDEARQMFVDGFFRRGRKLKESVLDYGEQIGVLAPSLLPRTQQADAKGGFAVEWRDPGRLWRHWATLWTREAADAEAAECQRLLAFVKSEGAEVRVRPLEPGGERLPQTDGPVHSPALIGPTKRRELPEELEFFADSEEQILASTEPYRQEMDWAFREAIERARSG